ncbi:hypothetical protein ACROYT_G042001 [Oculina patagonica]
MADKQSKLAKRKKKFSSKNAHDLTLEDVLAVGGDKDDFEMMKDVDVSGDFVVDEETSENIEEKEVMSYIRELGLDKISFKGKEMNESAAKENSSNMFPKSGEILNKDETEKENKGKKEKRLKSKDTEKGTDLAKSKMTVQEPQTLPERKGGPHQKLLIKPGGLWYELVVEEKATYPSPNQTDIVQLSKEAADLLENEVSIYEKMKAKEKSSDSQWLKSVVSSGTLNDKVAALTVQVQESAVHRLKTLDMLLGMAKKKGRRESIIAVDMLKELWMTLLLPSDHKLKKFAQHPLTSLVEIVHKGGGWDERDRRLILWHFEELLKQRYKEFIEVLEKLLQDTLVNIRSKMLGTIFDLLSEKPEQEQVLLSLLVNKIGDPDRKVASKAVYLTRSLVTKHPNMKLVVTKEIEKLLYRPNIALKAQYFAVCFLNQLILTKQDSELATRLISIYFSFFGAFLKKGDMEAKMLSALLTGVNRAFPFAKEEDEQYNEQINTLFRTVHIGTFNTSVQALMLLFQVMESRQSVSDRFYQALYAKLLDPSLKTSTKQAVFLNVLYKSLKSDPSLHRVKAFVKRILQVCSFQQPAFICGTLFMISELTKLKPGIKSLTQQPESRLFHVQRPCWLRRTGNSGMKEVLVASRFTMFARLLVWWLCIQQIASTKEFKRAFQSGDIILGGLNVLHYKDSQDKCGDFFPVGLGHTEAMIFAIEQINNDPSILPNATLGFDIRDYCEIIDLAVKETYEFVRDKDLYKSCQNNNYYDVDNETASCCSLFKNSAPVSMLIGPYDSASAVQIGSLLSVENIPIISFAATSDELSSAQFRYFLRTVPPDRQQARVQADLFEHFKWTYVGTAALDDSYGRFGVSALQNESYNRGTFCIAFSEFIPRLRAAQSIKQIVSRIKQQSNVKVIVLWVFGGLAKQFFEEAYRQKLGRRTWILGDATSTEDSGELGPYFSLLDGALGVQPHDHRDEKFLRHLTSLTPNETSFVKNPWWAEYWEQLRNCSVNIINETDPKCIDVPLSRNEAEKLFDPYLAYLTDAVYAAAHALDKSFECRDSEEKFPEGKCPQTKSSLGTGGTDILSYLKNVSFRGLTGTVEFDDHGDRKESFFEIVNIQVHGKGKNKKYLVGSWNSKEQQRLRLNDSAIKWFNGTDAEVPSSFCSEACSPGTRQEITRPCCWKCVKCPGDTVSKEQGSTNCTACPQKQKSNDAKTKCVDLPVKNLRLQDSAGVFLSCVTAVGFCVTAAALLVFLKYRETAIVKASNRQLSFLLLVTILFSFIVALLSIAEPTDFVCRVTQFSRYIIYTTFVTILWLKSVRIFVLFQIDASTMPLQSCISKVKYQVALVALVNSVVVVLLIAWFASDPPFRNETIQPTQYIFYTCKPYGSSVGKALYLIVCSYVLLLSLLSSFYAFKVRKLPDNFKEARFIGFSLYIILLSALCYYTVEFSVQEGWYVSVIACSTTLVDSFGLLGCMFAPKVFA